MKKWMKFVIVLMVVVGCAFTMFVPAVYAGQCTPYDNDWFRSGDLIQDPPFAVSNILNVHIADFRGAMCGFWVVYRSDSIIYVDAEVKEDGKKLKKRIELTKEIGSIWTDYVEIVYKAKLKNIKAMEKSKYSHFKKLDERTWEYIESKPFVMFSMEDENCEVKDLVTGKILKTKNDGFFISNKFIITEIK